MARQHIVRRKETAMLSLIKRMFRFLMESGQPYYTGVSTNPYETPNVD